MLIDPVFVGLFILFSACVLPGASLFLIVVAGSAASVVYGFIAAVRSGRRELARDVAAMRGIPQP